MRCKWQKSSCGSDTIIKTTRLLHFAVASLFLCFIYFGKRLPDIAGEIQRAQCAYRAFAAQFFRTRHTGFDAVRCFGGLCAAVYLFAKTPAFALSWWLSGLSYDALHGVGNFVLMLLLYRPLRRALQMAKKQLRV